MRTITSAARRGASSCAVHHGYTLIEVLVVIGICGALAAFLLPAIQASREASRRVQCNNNEMQLGKAILNFESAEGKLPADHGRNALSAFARVMPFLDPARANAINYKAHYVHPRNRRLGKQSLVVLQCSSDPSARWTGGSTSYAVNGGSGYQTFGENGAFTTAGVPLQSVTDGTSHTAAVSEWVVSTTPITRDPIGSGFAVPVPLKGPTELDQFADACERMDPSRDKIVGFKGASWIEGLVASTIYNHVMPINHHSCVNSGDATTGAWTAGSRHPGGANVLFLDGHTSFLSDTINRDVWRSLGSRNGGEFSQDN